MSRRVLGAGVAVLLAIVLGVWGVGGALKIREMRREIEAAEREIAELQRQRRELGATIDRLRHDPDYLEKLAREERGMVREGETVLKFPPRSQ